MYYFYSELNLIFHIAHYKVNVFRGAFLGVLGKAGRIRKKYRQGGNSFSALWLPDSATVGALPLPSPLFL